MIVSLFPQLNTLDCLGIYWNPDATLVTQNGNDKSEMIKCLKELITSQDYIPQGMNYSKWRIQSCIHDRLRRVRRALWWPLVLLLLPSQCAFQS